MLTGCRLSEVTTLKWDHVDIKARELRLPDSKTGAKVVHFGKTAADVLTSIKKLDGNPYVITGTKMVGSRLTDCSIPGGAFGRRPVSTMSASTIFGTRMPAAPSPWAKD